MPDGRAVAQLKLLRIQKGQTDANTAPDPIAEEQSIERTLHDTGQQANEGQARQP